MENPAIVSKGERMSQEMSHEMSHETSSDGGSPTRRDGLAAIAVVLLAGALIALLVSQIV